MKHGVHIPVEARDRMAARAADIANVEKTHNQAVIAVAAEFNVSEPTARNLISHGRFLRRKVHPAWERGIVLVD